MNLLIVHREAEIGSPRHVAQLAPAQVEIQMIGRTLIPMTKATTIPGSGRVVAFIHRMQTRAKMRLRVGARWPRKQKNLARSSGRPGQ